MSHDADEGPAPEPTPATKPKKQRPGQFHVHQGRGPVVAEAVHGEGLGERIERAFAEANKTNLRNTVRALEKLIPQLKDSTEQARYFQALDLLPDLVAHEMHT